MGAPLAYEVQQFICEQLGQFTPAVEIVGKVQERFQVKVLASQISRYKSATRWQPLILKARAGYLARVLDVPIANKTVRLERLEKLFHDALTAGKTSEHREEARAVLQAAREEMREPEKAGTTNVYIHQQIATLDTAALEARRREIVERLSHLGDENVLSEARTALQEAEPASTTPVEEIEVTESHGNPRSHGR